MTNTEQTTCGLIPLPTVEQQALWFCYGLIAIMQNFEDLGLETSVSSEHYGNSIRFSIERRETEEGKKPPITQMMAIKIDSIFREQKGCEYFFHDCNDIYASVEIRFPEDVINAYNGMVETRENEARKQKKIGE